MKCRYALLVFAVVIGSATSIRAVVLGDVTRVERDDRTVTVHCGAPAVRFEVWNDSVIRVWLSGTGQIPSGDSADTHMIRPGRTAFKGPRTLRVDDATDCATLRTEALTVVIAKRPFGLRFLKADGVSLLAATPQGLSLDTDIRAAFKRDACGREEHFFGLQCQNATTLDQREKTVRLEDQNGDGWPAPFVMSTAGYALFFNSEESKDTLFSLADPVVIENTAKQGPLDLFFFYGPDFRRLLDLYTDLTGKPPMPPKKLLGFQYLVQGTPITNEEAFPEWVQRGYPIDSCITFTDQRVDTPDEIAAVAATGQRIHALHGLFGFYYDVCSPGTFCAGKPEPVKPPYSDWTRFKTLVKTRLLDNGVDWFWIDETDDGWTPAFQFGLYQALTEATEAQDSRRSFFCARGGYAGCQRFGYPWMGDKDYCRSTVLANLCNGLAGIPHATHDMAGAGLAGKTAPAFLAGVKANLLNPLTQCNAWIPQQRPSHRPWEWSDDVQSVFRKFLDLHYRLMPYFYTTAWQAHTTGLPCWRALLLDYPDCAQTYASDEVLVGDWLLMAPLYTERSSRPVFLPGNGPWHYFFESDRIFDAPLRLASVTPPLDEYPVFVKAGAIIPMMPALRYTDEKPADPLTVLIYPPVAGESSYTLYEDDGATRRYKDGEFCTTQMGCQRTSDGVRVTIQARKGPFKPAPRTRLLSIYVPTCPAAVKANGREMKRFEKREAFDAATKGWGYFRDELTGCQRVFVKSADDGSLSATDIIRDAHAKPPTDLPPSATFAGKEAGLMKTFNGVSAATFVGEDRKTQGAWKGVYGTRGYAIAGVDASLKEDVYLRQDDSACVWKNDTAEVRALQKPQSDGRIASCRFGDDVELDVGLKGNESQQVALYVLDWDGNGNPSGPRALCVTAINPFTGEVYDTRQITRFTDGIYLTYTVKGLVSFSLTHSAGANAVLSGVFIGK